MSSGYIFTLAWPLFVHFINPSFLQYHNKKNQLFASRLQKAKFNWNGWFLVRYWNMKKNWTKNLENKIMRFCIVYENESNRLFIYIVICISIYIHVPDTFPASYLWNEHVWSKLRAPCLTCGFLFVDFESCMSHISN